MFKVSFQYETPPHFQGEGATLQEAFLRGFEALRHDRRGIIQIHVFYDDRRIWVVYCNDPDETMGIDIFVPYVNQGEG